MFLKAQQNLQENTCTRVSFLKKLQACLATLLKERLWHLCFPVNFAKLLWRPFSQNTSERLLVNSTLIRILLQRLNMNSFTDRFLKLIFKIRNIRFCNEGSKKYLEFLLRNRILKWIGQYIWQAVHTDYADSMQ